MKPSLLFATGNPNKLTEVRYKLGDQFEILSLDSIDFTGDIPETQATIEGNAIQKAQYIYDRYQIPCFAEDTGLEIDSLGGKPGVYSARYAGPQKSAEDNMALVLQQMKGHENRSARFKTVIAYIDHGQIHTFEGILPGRIAHQKIGDQGFGYDPIFIPHQYNQTFGELSAEIKSKISHRAIAVERFIQFILNQQMQQQQ